MIGLCTAVRVLPAFWLAVPLCILAGWYATISPSLPSDPYAVDATAAGTATLGFVGPFCAACAAWEGARLRRARLWGAPSVRSRVAIAFWSLLPIVLVGLVAVLVAIAVELVRFAAWPPDPRFIAMTTLDLVAYAAAGFAAGLLIPFVVAGPLAIVATLMWLAFVPAIEPVWLRHLTGMFRDCCQLQWDLAPRAVFASSITNLGIMGAAALLVAGPALVARRVAGAVATLGVAAAGGVVLVGGMAYAPAVPRDTSLLDCRAVDDVTMCIWPEHRTHAAEVARTVARVRAGWEDAGVDAPSVVTEADRAVAPPGALVFEFSGVRSTPDDIVSALAAGMLPAFPNCPGGATGGIAFQYLEAWYAAAGGMAPNGLQERYDYPSDPYPGVLTVVDQLRAATLETRRAWMSRAEEVAQACDEWPPDLITVQR